jgi:hypothetical protein
MQECAGTKELPSFVKAAGFASGESAPAGSTLVAASAAATPIVAFVRREAVGAVRPPLNADHRKNDHGRGLAVAVDIFADTRTALVWELDHFAHRSPHPVPAQSQPDQCLSTIKPLARLTLC